MMKTLMMLVMMLGMITLIGCGTEGEGDAADATEQTETATTDETQPAATQEPATEEVATEPASEESEIVTKDSGVRYMDLVVGTGVEAIDRMKVECHYTLWFSDSTGLVKGKRFQSSKDGGKSFECQLGVRLIAGWSDGMMGMKEGGTRRIFVPWALGYGDREGGQIPAKTNLVFEIDFIKAL